MDTINIVVDSLQVQKISEIITSNSTANTFSWSDIIAIISLTLSVFATIVTWITAVTINRARLNVVIYTAKDKIIYAVVSNTGNTDAYNVSIKFDGIKDKSPFDNISIIAKGTSYRAALLSTSNIRQDDMQESNCIICYNDRFRKRRTYKEDFKINLYKISKSQIEYKNKIYEVL